MMTWNWESCVSVGTASGFKLSGSCFLTPLSISYFVHVWREITTWLLTGDSRTSGYWVLSMFSGMSRMYRTSGRRSAWLGDLAWSCVRVASALLSLTGIGAAWRSVEAEAPKPPSRHCHSSCPEPVFLKVGTTGILGWTMTVFLYVGLPQAAGLSEAPGPAD